MKIHPNQIRQCLSLIAVISGYAFYSCQEMEIEPVLIQFHRNIESVGEGEEITIQLKLSKASSDPYKIVMSVESNGTFDQDFSMNPGIADGRLVLDVLPGKTTLSFTIEALDNSSFDNGKYVIFNLIETNEVVHTGFTPALTVVVEDDEAPSMASFAINSASVSESDTNGILVEILLSSPAIDTGKIFLSSSEIPNNFITDKPISGGVMELGLNKGDSKVSFTVFPIYNLACETRLITFTMSAFYGVVKSGNGIIYELTLTDKDVTTISIAESSGSISESDSNGILLRINIMPAAREDMKIYLVVSDYGMANRYSTIPPYYYDDIEYEKTLIPIDVPKNSTSADIKIIPINNSVKNGNYSVDFSLILGDSRPCLEINSTTKYRLTIEDDD